jgi:hypothetical protein
MGPNTTGKANTNDYQVGRGKLYWADVDSSGYPIKWRDLGNAPEFNLSIAVETLEHFSSREGLKSTDKEVVISQKVSCAFKLDEWNNENMALLFSGAKATHTNVGVAGFTEYVMVADGNLELGRWYDIQNSSKARAYDVDPTKLTVKTNETTPVTLVKDTDYEVDTEMGRIFILSSSTKAQTSITAGKGLKVTLTADATADAVNEVRALTTTNVVGALKFIAINPANNDAQAEFVFHKISLKADGDSALIGDDWGQMGFTAAAEKNEVVSPNSPTLTVRVVA